MKDNFLIIVVGLFIISIIGLVFLFVYAAMQDPHEHKCLKGHYANQTYYDPVLKMPVIKNTWICDEELLIRR